MAPQQQFLVEISAKLDEKTGVEEVLARHDDDRVGTLRHISELALEQAAASRGLPTRAGTRGTTGTRADASRRSVPG